jgi:hypothetical protein
VADLKEDHVDSAPPSTTRWGRLVPSSLQKYAQAQRAYLTFCETPVQAVNLARWRTHLAQNTLLRVCLE